MCAGMQGKAQSLAPVAPSKRVAHRLECDAWAMFWNAPLPPSLWDFIYQNMWCKLWVRVRLFPWLQVIDCPLCGKDETSRHAIKYCKFFKHVQRAMHSCFRDWRIQGKTGPWIQLPIAQTLHTAPVTVLWCARKAHQGARSVVSMGASPSMEDLVTKWAGEINVATRWEPLKQHSKALVEFHATLLFFLRERTIPQRHIKWQQYCPSAVPGMSSYPKQQRQEERKATLAKQVKALVHTYLREGWKTFFFNGSAKRYDECGYVGGI